MTSCVNTEQCTSAQASILRGMVERHSLLPKVAFDNSGSQARALAAGHGFGDLRGFSEIKHRLKVELGFSGTL
ncbi:hypothetical protein V1509DRAFT_4242 [Lipomyces kononenkoae]